MKEPIIFLSKRSFNIQSKPRLNISRPSPLGLHEKHRKMIISSMRLRISYGGSRVTAVRPEEGAKAFRHADIRQPTGGSENHVPGYRESVQHIPSIRRRRRSLSRRLRARVTWNLGGLYRDAESQEGPELLQGLAVPTTLEADCRTVHQEPARREHAQAEQVIVAALSRKPIASSLLAYFFHQHICRGRASFTVTFRAAVWK